MSTYVSFIFYFFILSCCGSFHLPFLLTFPAFLSPPLSSSRHGKARGRGRAGGKDGGPGRGGGRDRDRAGRGSAKSSSSSKPLPRSLARTRAACPKPADNRRAEVSSMPLQRLFMTNENQEQLRELLRDLQSQDFDEPYE